MKLASGKGRKSIWVLTWTSLYGQTCVTSEPYKFKLRYLRATKHEGKFFTYVFATYPSN